MHTSIRLASDIIKSFEGLALKPYRCPAGKRTIGYGHIIKGYERFGKAADETIEITEDFADELLTKDIMRARSSVYRYCFVPLSAEQEAALISFVFNCGGGAFYASSLRQKLNREEYIRAADEFLRWVYAGGLKLPGLVRRRTAERELFLSGTEDFL